MGMNKKEKQRRKRRAEKWQTEFPTNDPIGEGVRTYKDGWTCGCGNSKIYDASMCDECWKHQSQYDDGRG